MHDPDLPPPDRDPEAAPARPHDSPGLPPEAAPGGESEAPGRDPDDLPWQTTPPPRRRWPFVVVALLLAAGAAAASLAAWLNFEAGSGWQERAFAEQARAVAAETRAEQLEADLARTAQLLERSEQDVSLLESRLAALASEKAGAEDSAALATGVAEELTAVTVFAAQVGSSLRDCIARNVALTNDIIAAHGTDQFDAAATNARIDSVNRVCADAEDEYDQLRRRLDALGS